MLSPLLLLIPGKSEVSLLAQDEVREKRSVSTGPGIALELVDLERLDTLTDRESDGLRFFPDKCLILVQNLKS